MSNYTTVPNVEVVVDGYALSAVIDDLNRMAANMIAEAAKLQEFAALYSTFDINADPQSSRRMAQLITGKVMDATSRVTRFVQQGAEQAVSDSTRVLVLATADL